MKENINSNFSKMESKMSDDHAAPPDLQDVLDENQTSIFHLSLLNKKKEGKDLFGGKKSMCI